MSAAGDTITNALAKLRRARRVARAQRALDGDVGQEVIAKCFGKPMGEPLRARMKALSEQGLKREGHEGITVEVVFHLDKRLVELRAHAEDQR